MRAMADDASIRPRKCEFHSLPIFGVDLTETSKSSGSVTPPDRDPSQGRESSSSPAEAQRGRSKCPGCGDEVSIREFKSKDLNLSSSGTQFEIRRCSRCGLVYTSDGGRDLDMKCAYPASYPCHLKEKLSDRTFKRRLSEMVARATGSLDYSRLCNAGLADYHEVLGKSGGRALDVGCGAGLLMEVVRRDGWKVSGAEPFATAASIAASRGFDVCIVRAEELDLERDAYDLIIMHHSLEHVHDPNAALSACRKGLKPTGVMVIAVPNWDSPGRRFFGEAWPPLDIPRHTVHFTPATLEELLNRNLLTVTRCYFENSFGDVVTGLRNLIRRRLTRLDLNAVVAPSAAARRVGLLTILSVMNSLIAVVYGPVLRAFGLGSRTAFVMIVCRT